MSTTIQAAYTTYPSRLRTGNTPLVIPSLALSAHNRAILHGGPPPIIHRTSTRRYRDDDDSGDEEDEFLEVESERGQDEEDDAGESGGFVIGPPAEVLISRRPRERTKHVIRSDAQMEGAAQAEEVLIPIRIDLDIDNNIKIKDVFTWNMNEELITPIHFAQILCQDLDISPQIYAPQIASSIRTQLEEYAPVAEITLPPDSEMRVIVNLQLHLAKHLLRDSFEWDLSAKDEGLTVEEFSKRLCLDLSLSSDFPPSLSHAIHETLLSHKRTAIDTPLPSLQNESAYSTPSGIRIDPEGLGARWGPTLEVLSREEIERREGDRERQVRRLRRDTARFGVGVMAVDDDYGGRSRRKRRRSVSPRGGADTPGGGIAETSIAKAFSLSEAERLRWRCLWCLCPGAGTVAVRNGPKGTKTLCNNCGVWFARDGRLPDWREKLFING